MALQCKYYTDRLPSDAIVTSIFNTDYVAIYPFRRNPSRSLWVWLVWHVHDCQCLRNRLG